MFFEILFACVQRLKNRVSTSIIPRVSLVMVRKSLIFTKESTGNFSSILFNFSFFDGSTLPLTRLAFPPVPHHRRTYINILSARICPWCTWCSAEMRSCCSTGYLSSQRSSGGECELLKTSFRALSPWNKTFLDTLRILESAAQIICCIFTH